MTRPISPPRAWRDITDFFDLEARLERVREWLERVTKRIASLTVEEKGLATSQQALTLHPGNDPRARFQLAGIVTLAVLLTVTDTPLQALLNQASFPGIQPWVWWLVSPALAIGIAAFTHGAAVAFLHDRHRPARSLRLCRVLAWTFFIIVALSGSVLLYVRVVSADVAGSVLTMATVCLWITTEALPIAAGLFSAWAHFLGEPMRITRRLAAVREERNALERFHEKLVGEEEQIVRRIPAAAQAAAGTSMKAAVAPLALALLVGVMNATAAHAQSPERSCAVALDITYSVDPSYRFEAVSLLQAQLPPFAAAFDCQYFLLLAFTDKGAYTPRSLHRVPPALRHTDCSRAAPLEMKGASAILTNTRGVREYASNEGARRCAKLAAADSLRHAADWKRITDEFRALGNQSQSSPSTATDIHGVLESLLDAVVVVVASDLLNSAGEIHAAPSLRRVVGVAIPARSEYGGRAATDSAALALRAAGARVIPFTALVVPGAWRQTAQPGDRAAVRP